jgi:lipopolysaccharide/colanic/teichoic acid biosynthesis glycosyltransferase
MTYRDVRRLPGAAAPARPAGPAAGRPFTGPAARRSWAWTRTGKPLFDAVLASLSLVILCPLLVAVAVLIRLTTPGPALIRQTRVGRGRRPFVLYKFRSMYTGNSDEQHRLYVRKLLTEDEPPAGGRRGLFKLEDDPRVTPVGRLLRKTSIDELPQLFNVIRGDMSLVGPRPVLPWEVEMIGEAHGRRFEVRPGITGLWQVSGRSRLTMRQGLELDVEYASRQSFAFDLMILLKTVPTVLSARGAR